MKKPPGVSSCSRRMFFRDCTRSEKGDPAWECATDAGALDGSRRGRKRIFPIGRSCLGLPLASLLPGRRFGLCRCVFRTRRLVFRAGCQALFELGHGLTKRAREFGQLLGAEEEHTERQRDPDILWSKHHVPPGTAEPERPSSRRIPCRESSCRLRTAAARHIHTLSRRGDGDKRLSGPQSGISASTSFAKRARDSCQPRQHASGGMTAGTPSWTTCNSVPQETRFKVIVVCISPGRFGSSNLSVWRMRSCGTSSRNSPPKE